MTARLLRREALRRAAAEMNTTSGPGLESVLARISAEVTAEAAAQKTARDSAREPAPAGGIYVATTSSVKTWKLASVLTPNVLLIGTSTASRPRPIRTRPIRGMLLRGSKVCQAPPRYASSQPAKSIGP